MEQIKSIGRYYMVRSLSLLAIGPRQLAFETLDLADPRADEVVMKPEYVGVCHTDITLVAGQLRDEFPVVAGHEVAGVVEWCGELVKGVVAGDRVVVGGTRNCGYCKYCESGHPMLCEERLNARPRLLFSGANVTQGFGIGGFSTKIIINYRGLVKVPVAVGGSEAAILGCAVATGAGAVIKQSCVRPGERVAIVGIGGIGGAAILACRLIGVSEICAIDPDPKKVQLALDLGATETVECGLDRDSVASVPQEFDVVVESSGNVDAMSQTIEIVRRGGRVVLCGIAGAKKRVSFNAHKLVLKQINVCGSVAGDVCPQVDIARYLSLVATKQLPVNKLIGEMIDFDNGLIDRLCLGTVETGLRTVVAMP